MNVSTVRCLAACLTMSCIAWGDLDKVQAELRLERRSELALVHADEELNVAKKAYEDGEFDAFRRSVNEVGELAELSLKSLEDTGKRARRSPRYWKRAEQRMLVLMRRLDGLERAVSIDDRAAVEAARKRVIATHESVLNAIMTKK
ncbi:MAG TPA: hypothetical protein VES20_15620 [Bryobacteraceae bacterium]|nr:hypothetical protein [Bryobacteraceae bacterium]